MQQTYVDLAGYLFARAPCPWDSSAFVYVVRHPEYLGRCGDSLNELIVPTLDQTVERFYLGEGFIGWLESGIVFSNYTGSFLICDGGRVCRRLDLDSRIESMRTFTEPDTIKLELRGGEMLSVAPDDYTITVEWQKTNGSLDGFGARASGSMVRTPLEECWRQKYVQR